MRVDEIGVVIDYFHGSTAEHLDMLGVDPERLPEPDAWHRMFEREFDEPVETRPRLLVIWESDDGPVGFSSADTITIGDQARMHLHVLGPENRRRGVGTECVRQSVRLYFDTFRLQRLICEPNALNVAPNRTLQRVGFRYVMTYMTVPGWLNFHQPVTRWVFERDQLATM